MERLNRRQHLVLNRVAPVGRWHLSGGGTSRRDGQSLLEALVALAVAMLVILALVWVTTVSVRNADFAKKQAQAAKYAQEGMENMRTFRDKGWNGFWIAADGAIHGLSGPTPSGSCPSTPNLANTFIRCVKLEQTGTDKVKATVTVSWTDSTGTHKSEQISYFTKW